MVDDGSGNGDTLTCFGNMLPSSTEIDINMVYDPQNVVVKFQMTTAGAVIVVKRLFNEAHNNFHKIILPLNLQPLSYFSLLFSFNMAPTKARNL